jgi:hypothetical protein
MGHGRLTGRMKTVCYMVFLSVALGTLLQAQQQLDVGESRTQSSFVMPRLIRYSSVLNDEAGMPRTGLFVINFFLYSHLTDSRPLWQEVHEVTADSWGRFTVLLGSKSPGGIPFNLFYSYQVRWMGMQVAGEMEAKRQLFVTVPYAVQAASADSLGGRPAKDFVSAEQLRMELANQMAEILGTGPAPITSAAVSAPPVIATHSLVSRRAAGAFACSPGAPALLTQTNIFQSCPSGTIIPQILGPVDQATSTTAFSSNPLDFTASLFNAGTAQNVVYRWEADPIGNNMSNPTAEMRLSYGAAGAALTQILGISAGSNYSSDPAKVASVLYKSPTGLAPFAWPVIGAHVYSGVSDDAIYSGFNVTRGGAKINPAAAKLSFAMETNYFTNNINYMEYNFDFTTPNNTVSTRPLAFQISRDTGQQFFWWFRIGVPGTDSKFVITDTAATKELFRIDPLGSEFVGQDVHLTRSDANPAIVMDDPTKYLRFIVGGTERIYLSPNLDGLLFSSTADANLYRSSAGVLRTDGNLSVGRALDVNSVFNDGKGLKHIRLGTGSIPASSTTAVDLFWTSAFRDSNYTCNCSVVDASSSSSGLRLHHLQAVTPSGVIAIVVNDDATSAHIGVLHCAAFHD